MSLKKDVPMKSSVFLPSMVMTAIGGQKLGHCFLWDTAGAGVAFGARVAIRRLATGSFYGFLFSVPVRWKVSARCSAAS